MKIKNILFVQENYLNLAITFLHKKLFLVENNPASQKKSKGGNK